MFMVVIVPDVDGVPTIVTIPFPSDPVKGVPYNVLFAHEVDGNKNGEVLSMIDMFPLIVIDPE